MAKTNPGLNTAQCPYCKEWINPDASRCPHCQSDFTPADKAGMKKERKSNLIGCGALGLIGFLALGFCSLSGESAEETDSAPLPDATYSDADRIIAAEPDPAAMLTGPQRNARRSAEAYLAMSGFSRQGLIDQLSSDAGDGYSVADATAAVDSLDVDYNEQATRAAQAYLQMSGFSCKGLIQQLSSSAGDDYTREQAEFGAKQAGAC